MMFEKNINSLRTFLKNSHSSFHVVRNLKEELVKAGYRELREDERWNLKAGEKCFVVRNSSSLLAFRLPEEKAESLNMIAVHSDAPVFKIKPNPEMSGGGDTIRLNIEKYGGMLTAPWFDRPLTAAGRILTEEADGTLRERLVYIDRDLLLIPSLAIHMDRQANEKAHGNVQTEMLPLFGSREDASEEASGRKNVFLQLIAEEAGVKADAIVGADLYLTTRMEPSVWGLRQEFLSAQRLDDLECCWGAFSGFLSSGNAEGAAGILPVFCIFDNEEVGSHTRQGAASDFLAAAITRICEGLGMSAEEKQILLAKSFLVSADNAQAVNPNYPEKSDPVNRPQINKGIVLKHHAGQKYTTDAVSAAIIRSLCRRHDIPLQDFTNRSDTTSGTTLGNIAATRVSVRTADIGLAQLAMHSCYETAGVKDPLWLAEFAHYLCLEALPGIGLAF